MFGFDSWFEMFLPVLESGETFVRSEPRLIYFFLFAFGVDESGSKAAGPMKVEVIVEGAHVEVIDLSSVTARDMGIAHLFSNDAAVFPLNESIVVGPPGAGFGLFDKEFIEELGDAVVDELRAIVGMKPRNSKGETRQEVFQQRFQEDFGNTFNGTDDFPLGDFVNDVDVINAFDFISIPLMNGIHTQIPWTTVRRGFFPCADIAFNGPGLGPDQSAPLVVLGGA